MTERAETEGEGRDQAQLHLRGGKRVSVRAARQAIAALTVALLPIALVIVTWADLPDMPRAFSANPPESNLLGTPTAIHSIGTPAKSESKRKKAAVRRTSPDELARLDVDASKVPTLPSWAMSGLSTELVQVTVNAEPRRRIHDLGTAPK